MEDNTENNIKKMQSAQEMQKVDTGTATKKRNKSGKIVLISIISVLLAIVIFFIGFFVGGVSCTNLKIKEIMYRINQNSSYVQTIDNDDIARAIVSQILKEDKFAKYYDKEEFETVQKQDDGEYSGFGFSFITNSDGSIASEKTIYEVIKNSPADHAGIKSGDEIVSARILPDGEKQNIKSQLELYSFLSNTSTGTQVEFFITRAGEFENKLFTVTKEEYTATYVEYYDNTKHLYFYSQGGAKTEEKTENSGMTNLASDMAYISFSAFEGDAARELKTALDYMKENGKKKLILDLRGNGGGLMTVLSDIASYFVNDSTNSKTEVAAAKDKNGEVTKFYTSKNNQYGNIAAISVLADSGTASASECLIGALLYYGSKNGNPNFTADALVLNYNSSRSNYSTYGKGIMQTTYSLITGGAIKMTTAFIYQPDETTCIHGIGITTANEKNHVEKGDSIARAVEILNSK